ncbi:AzlD domain-containing protein [Thalassococcus sp. S3]|uniref:AzlD domain-containing protein n=1 Tax=Thalassococcus sp. S3 TaxID=2017482 RepID=UPI0010245DA3|nr:AzlD domain-containing protein [Thalassococcus sp. S3]QBF32489.1 hypothetical protein CFI11_14875 [Thalassococcus sp. S3]
MSDSSFTLALVVMAVTVFVTRCAGALLMSRVSPTPKSERFLEGVAASVISALVASQIMTGGLENLAAVIVAILIMLVSGSIVGAMLAGMITAAAGLLIFPDLS